MCKEQEVQVKKKYLIEVLQNDYERGALKESCKEYYTLDEFMEVRKCVYSNRRWVWDGGSAIASRVVFNKALELQKNVNKENLNRLSPKISDDIKSIDFVVSILDNCCEYLDATDQRKHDYSVRLLKVVIDQLKQR